MTNLVFQNMLSRQAEKIERLEAGKAEVVAEIDKLKIEKDKHATDLADLKSRVAKVEKPAPANP